MRLAAAGSSTADDDLQTVIGPRDCQDLVDLYLRLIHDKPHTLFHPPSLRRQVHDGSLPKPVLFGILAIASRLSESPVLQARAAEFFQLAKSALKQNIDCICLENIQACILVGNLCGVEGDNGAEVLWYGIAFRTAEILGLPQPDPADDAVAQEVRLRIWWSLYMIDRWSSAGSGLPRQLAHGNDYPLPMDELQFTALCPGSPQTPTVPMHQPPGLWGQMVKLANIFAHIQDLHRQHADHPDGHTQAEAETRRLAGELGVFLNQLPDTAVLTEENMRRLAAQGHGSTLVALHLGYHHYATLLYFPYLDLQLERTETHLFFAAQCKHHAAAFSDLLLASRKIPHCDAVYFIVAHMAVVSSAALLHTLLFGDDAELPQTRHRLEANFETIVQLRRYWPAVSHLMDRLFAFQSACMWSADPNTHKIDRWMVRFLLNHALPVSDKKSMHENLEAAGSDRFLQRGQVAGEALSILRPDTLSS